MAKLPIVNVPASKTGLRILVHGLRVLIFLSILCLIRFSDRQIESVESQLESSETAIRLVESTFPGANIGPFNPSLQGNVITDKSGKTVGCIVQTSPESDHIIGYSGPTNCLIALGLESQIEAIAISNSNDTVEHVAIVRQDGPFLESFRGLGFETQDQWKQIDAVSGATLTSYAIIASVANRMSGSAPSLKFQAEPDLKNVGKLFAGATTLQLTQRKSVWDVFDASGDRMGFVLSTTPAADHLSGYQGPTATLAGFDSQEKCVGLLVDQSYDNQPYATYLNDDYGFLDFYIGKTMEELSQMDAAGNGIEGVSGATMTSLCVAEGLPLAADAALNASETESARSGVATRSLMSYWADGLTIVLTLMGVAFSFTRWKHQTWFRITFQVGVVLILGFSSGHMLSQASIAGWATHAIPWRVAPGLVMLSVAALVVPIVSKHQPYCHHICPFGALQQLGRNRIGWKLPIPQSAGRMLEWIPFGLLAWVVFIAVTRSTFNLAGIEPFDGFEFRVAGWATIGVFVGGLGFSLVSPMGYCRFGCPTGAMLNFLRFRATSDRLGWRDLAAVMLMAVAMIGMFR